jgi:predicted PurR-regulated permease PerM
MPGPTQDTISRYQPPQDLYSVQNNPHGSKIKQSSHSENLYGKDSLRTQQTRLEREMFDKFRTSIPNDAVILVGKAGKFVFLAIMLPPYIFLYGIPKFMMVQVLPFLFEASKTGISKFVSILIDFSALVAIPLQALKKQLKRVQKKVQNLAETISKQMQAFAEMAKRGMERLTSPFVKAYDRVSKFFAKLQMPHITFPKFSLKLPEIKNPFGFVSTLAEQAMERLKALREKLANFPPKLKMPSTDLFSNMAEKITEQAKAAAKVIDNALVAFISPPIDFAKDKIAYALKGIEEIIKMIQEGVARVLSPIQTLSNAVINLFVIPQFVKTWGERSQNALMAMIRNIRRLIKKIPNPIKWLKKMAGKFQQMAKSALLKLKGLKKLPKKAASYLMIVLKKVFSLINWILYCLMILAAWISILVRYGWLQVRLKGEIFTKN